MTIEEFGEWVRKLQPIMQRQLAWREQREQIDKVLANCPIKWREPIRVMAQGAYYYSADQWMRENAE